MIAFYPATTKEPSYYLDEATTKKYRRVLGGIAWPQPDQEGIALVVMETFDDPAKYRIMAAVSDYNALILLDKAKALEVEYPVKNWHGDQKNMAMMQMLYEYNRNKDSADKLRFQGAPLAGEKGNSGYYLPMIVEMIKVGQERLAISPDTDAMKTISGALSSILPEQFNTYISAYPALAAVSYPLSFMASNKAVVTKPKRIDLRAKYGSSSWQV